MIDLTPQFEAPVEEWLHSLGIFTADLETWEIAKSEGLDSNNCQI